jgi:N-acetylneuraminic acid mutarotase
MPTARGALGAVALDGKVFAVGGVGADGNTGALEVFDPETNRWSPLSPMPTPRDHIAAGHVAGHLIVVGGRTSTFARNLDTNELYDPGSDRWERKAAIPTPRSGIGGAEFGGLFFVFGGESPAGTFNEAEAYDPGSDRWVAFPTMPTARHGLGAVTLGNRIYILAGGRTPGFAVSDLNEILEFGQ